MEETALSRTELVAVVLGLETGPRDEPTLGVLTSGAGDMLPAGPLQTHQPSLQRSLRQWVQDLTGYRLGHTEQLYTFADKQHDTSDDPRHTTTGPRTVRISYLTLARPSPDRAPWRSVYDFFLWEDRRLSETLPLLASLVRQLVAWAGPSPERQARCATAFALDGHDWNDELVLSRYELLWEAGLLPESRNGIHGTATSKQAPGLPMRDDHRRILATALSRLRARIRYTAAVFDLLPERFTLLQLQQAMEALAGRPMHKQNFRRLVQNQGLVEETSALDPRGQGRPARLYRFRPSGAQDCYLAGAKLSLPPIS